MFINIALYFLLAEKDISAVKLDALTHPDWWTRGVALRTILLTVHEWDMGKVTGKRLQQAMEEVAIPDALQYEVVASLRELRKTQRRAKKMLGHARNSAFAHRDADALIQYRAIRDLEAKAILEIAAEFYDAADRFVAVFPRLIVVGGSLPSLIRQYLKSGD